MGNTYLAIDIGASSGRHILGYVKEGRLVLEEIHRFTNGMEKKNDNLCWDYDHLRNEILEGIRKSMNAASSPVSIGIDTWGVDYVLLDAEDQPITPTYGYRDHRTDTIDQEVYKIIPREELYARTGILKASYNTIYQLMADHVNTPERLAEADSLLMVPDFLNYLLTGVKTNEYTEATTSQLVDPQTRNWDYELIHRLAYPEKIFGEIVMPGTKIGLLSEAVLQKLLPENADAAGGSDIRPGNGADSGSYNGTDKAAGIGPNAGPENRSNAIPGNRTGGLPEMQVIAVGSHDTASAVAAIPATDAEDYLYISSGTWSLMGVVREQPDCSKAAEKANFTNEGGCGEKICFHKNIMGLWMIQSLRHEYQDAYSFAELCDLAEEANDFPSRVDVNDDMFLSPESMREAIQTYCRQSGQPVPDSPGTFAAVIYQSLAECYAKTAREIEELTGKKYQKIMIVGGGSNASYLNQLTASASGKTVYAGIGEATSLGNIITQMISSGELKDYAEAKELIGKSFPMKRYEP
ncbi:MAG: rhamnulokinase [Eubacterium sp.]|nr:rhamnulokinase [Eubacterium sp.]